MQKARQEVQRFSPAHRDYAAWVDAVWNRPGDRDPSENVADIGSFAVTGLGIAGESVEVYDEVILRAASGTTGQALIEELGDVRYYWFRMCSLIGQPPERCMGSGAPPSRLPEAAALKLVLDCSRAAEAIKKHLRDGGHNVVRVQAALCTVDDDYVSLLASLGVDEEHIFAVNRDKLAKRAAATRRRARPA